MLVDWKWQLFKPQHQDYQINHRLLEVKNCTALSWGSTRRRWSTTHFKFRLNQLWPLDLLSFILRTSFVDYITVVKCNKVQEHVSPQRLIHETWVRVRVGAGPLGPHGGSLVCNSVDHRDRPDEDEPDPSSSADELMISGHSLFCFLGFDRLFKIIVK